MTDLYERIVNHHLTLRRITISANRVIPESQVTDYEVQSAEKKALEREDRIQRAVLEIQRRYGKNAILKGMNLEKGARTQERNQQVGGHKA